jgi:hypothetical protein
MLTFNPKFSGYFVCAKGTHEDHNHWKVNFTQGYFVQRENSENLETPVVQINVKTAREETNVNKSLWEKTADFACRTLSGASSAAIPFALTGAYQAWTGTAPTLATAGDVALFSTGLGLLAAGPTENSSEAFNRGLQFGAVAQAATLVGGVGAGTVLNKAVDLKNWSGPKLTNAGNGISTGVTRLTALYSENIYEPICNKLNKAGYAASFLPN